jgi:hypothetical protein
MADEVARLAQGLGISESRLVSLRHVYRERYEDEEQAEAKLLEWLRDSYEELRDRPRLLRKTLPGGSSRKGMRGTGPVKGSARSGIRRDLPEPERRERKPRVVEPPDLEEIKKAAEASAYTESPSESLRDAGEEPPPNEVASYRKSREARDNYQAEQMDEVGNLLSACRELRAAIDAMPKERKQSMSRTLWTLRGRLDQAERELRRRVAA